MEEGSGIKPEAGQTIKAHYAGYLLNGKKFDSSYDRNQPLKFKVGAGQVIKGWDEALLDMKVGEKRVLKIPASACCPYLLMSDIAADSLISYCALPHRFGLWLKRGWGRSNSRQLRACVLR